MAPDTSVDEWRDCTRQDKAPRGIGPAGRFWVYRAGARQTLLEPRRYLPPLIRMLAGPNEAES